MSSSQGYLAVQRSQRHSWGNLQRMGAWTELQPCTDWGDLVGSPAWARLIAEGPPVRDPSSIYTPLSRVCWFPHKDIRLIFKDNYKLLRFVRPACLPEDRKRVTMALLEANAEPVVAGEDLYA